jgi:hypothetical protein
MPSDISAYVSNKTAKEILGPDASIEHSLTGVKIKGSTPSGGTFATAIYNFEELTFPAIQEVISQRVLSPGRTFYHFVNVKEPECISFLTVRGRTQPPSLFYNLTPHSPPITGAFFLMRGANTAIVDRTWGLHEVQVRQRDQAPEHLKRLAYGPNFVYDEFIITNNAFFSLLINIATAVITFCLLMPPVSRLVFSILHSVS